MALATSSWAARADDDEDGDDEDDGDSDSGSEPSIVTQRYDNRGNEVRVIADFVSQYEVETLKNLISTFGDWRYRPGSSRRGEFVDHPDDFLGDPGIRFNDRAMQPRWLATTDLWTGVLNELQTLNVSTGAGDSRPWDVLDVETWNYRRGDPVRVYQVCNGAPDLEAYGSQPGDVVLLLYITSGTKEDNYGEAGFFNRGTVVGLDSFMGVAPVSGRAILFPCEVPFRLATPSVDDHWGQTLLRVVITKDKDRADLANMRAKLRIKGDDPARAEQELRELAGKAADRDDGADDDDDEEEEGRGREDEDREDDEEGGEEEEEEGRAGTEQAEVGPDGTSHGSSASKPPVYQGGDLPPELTVPRGFDELGLPRTPAEVDAASHESVRHQTTNGRFVHVFDGVFDSRKALDILRDHVIHNMTYSFDDSIDADTDNVQWIVGFDDSALPGSALWPLVQGIVNSVAPWEGFYPYDVSMNVIRSWDHTKIHNDCGKWELEYTCLMFINGDLGPHDGAETVFWDDADGGQIGQGPDAKKEPEEDEEEEEEDEEEGGGRRGRGKPARGRPGRRAEAEEEEDVPVGMARGKGETATDGKRRKEVLAIVRPVPGRVAVFNGNVPHSARPPASHYGAIRYTMAIKMSSSRVAAKAKALATHMHGAEESVQVMADKSFKQARRLRGKKRKEALRAGEAWEDRLERIQEFSARVTEIQQKVTANDEVDWRAADKRKPPAAANDPKLLAELYSIEKQLEVWTNEIEVAGRLELTAALGGRPSSRDGLLIL